MKIAKIALQTSAKFIRNNVKSVTSFNKKLFTNLRIIAGTFNNCFFNIGSSLSKQIPWANSLPSYFLNNWFLKFLLLKRTEKDEIEEPFQDLIVVRLKVFSVFQPLIKKKISP